MNKFENETKYFYHRDIAFSNSILLTIDYFYQLYVEYFDIVINK